jgi:hypothetical protein
MRPWEWDRPLLEGNTNVNRPRMPKRLCDTSRLPHFPHNQLTDWVEVVSLTRQPPFTPRNIPGTQFCYRLSRSEVRSEVGRIKSVHKSNDLIWNRSHNLSACRILAVRKKWQLRLVQNLHWHAGLVTCKQHAQARLLAKLNVIQLKDKSQNSLKATHFSYIKQCSNQSELMEYNSGVRLPLPT